MTNLIVAIRSFVNASKNLCLLKHRENLCFVYSVVDFHWPLGFIWPLRIPFAVESNMRNWYMYFVKAPKELSPYLFLLYVYLSCLCVSHQESAPLTTYIRIFLWKVVVVHLFRSLPSCTQSKFSLYFSQEFSTGLELKADVFC